MSSYGPPGQGQPEDPYRQPGPPPGGYQPPPPPQPNYPPQPDYPQPAPPDPTSGGAPSYPPAGGYPPPPPPPPGQPPAGGGPAGPEYPPPPGASQWGGPTPGIPVPPPAKPNKGLKIALIIGAVVLLVLCLCGGLVAYGVANLEDDDAKSAATAASPTASPSPTAGTVRPTPSRTRDRDDFAKGDCVVNDGTKDDAELRKVPCEPGAYEILAKIPFSTDTEQCKNQFLGSPDTDATFTRDAPGTLNDFVLCMKEL